MIKKNYFLIFSVLQLIVAFAMVPLLILKQTYGAYAVMIYALTSILILLAYGFWLWQKGRAGFRDAEIGALGLGMIMAFLMSEIVAITVMILN